MKAKQIHEMSNAELQAKLAELKSDLFNLRFRLATGQLETPMQVSACKKDIARVMTVIREGELNIVRKAKA